MMCQCVNCRQWIREPDWTQAAQQGHLNADAVYWCPNCQQQVQAECQAHLWHDLSPHQGDRLIRVALHEWFA